MFKVIISDIVIYKIDDFIDKYLNSNLNIFIDSGIDNIDLIISGYETTAKIFRGKIYTELNNKLSNEIIGLKENELGFQTTISIGNYRLFINLDIDFNEKIRFVTDINIFKK